MTEREPEELSVALVMGAQTPDERFVAASTLTGRFGLPARVKPNVPEGKQGGEAGRKARKLKWRPRQGMPIDTFTRKKRCVALVGACQSAPVNDAVPSTV